VAWLAQCLADETFDILGRGTSGPSNIHAVGLDLTLTHLLEAINAAWTASGLEPLPVEAACLVMAGVDRVQEAELFTEWAYREKIAHLVQVTNDCEGLLAAGTLDGWGIALVAGTGSITFGKTKSGKTMRTGGWGYLMGDEGSAYNVALAGLKAAVRAADGRDPPTRLLPDFLERLELKQPDDLLEAVYLDGRDRAWIASLADVVTAAADADDPAAHEILHSAAEELALLVATTARKLGLDAEPIPICFTGGLILNAPTVQERLAVELTLKRIRVTDCVAVDHPVWGAIKLAKQFLDAETLAD
jgi:N-acetylglucosamine kinase-like BadF-type ATPase